MTPLNGVPTAVLVAAPSVTASSSGVRRAAGGGGGDGSWAKTGEDAEDEDGSAESEAASDGSSDGSSVQALLSRVRVMLTTGDPVLRKVGMAWHRRIGSLND